MSTLRHNSCLSSTTQRVNLVATFRGNILLMKTIPEMIGERLKSLRERKGYSQAQLSKLCGWSTASRVGHYEYGTRNVGIDDAMVLAKALDTTPIYIMFGEQDHGYAELPEKQRLMLELFRQLPEIEQDNVIGFTQLRIKEAEKYVEQYLKGRFKKTDA